MHEGHTENSFTAIGTVAEVVHAASPTKARTGYAVFRAGDGLEVAVPEAVIERGLAFGRQAAPNEWHGLLVGKLCEDAGQRHVVILGIVPDSDAVAKPSYVETTVASELRTRLTAKLLFPDGIVIGWIHGHVRHGVRFSSTDRATQRTWTQPHALGIVVDPWDKKRLSVYRGPESELLTPINDDRTEPDDCAAQSPAIGRRPRFAFPARLRRLGGRKIVAVLAVCALVLLAYREDRLSRRLEALQARVGHLDDQLAAAMQPPSRAASTPPATVTPDLVYAAPADAGVCVIESGPYDAVPGDNGAQ